MAIEFSCPHCQHQLRTGDDKAGLSAKCPACGEIIWVPYSTGATAASTPPPTPGSPPPIGGIPLASEVSAASGDEPAQADPTAAQESTGEIPRRRPQPELVCPGCQATNDATAERCRYCGTSLEGVHPVDYEPPPLPAFDVGEIMNTAWKLYTQELGVMLGATVVMTFLPLVVILPLVIVGAIAAAALKDDALFAIIPLIVIAIPLLFVLSSALTLGYTKLYLNIARGDPRAFSDLFWGFMQEGRPLIPAAMLVTLTAGVLIFFGGLLCCAPGLLVMLCWWPALPMLVDRRITGSDTIGQTYELAKRELGAVLGLGAIAAGVQVAAQMIPYLNAILILFALPLSQLLTAVGYLRLTRQPTVQERWKATAQPSATT